MRERNVATHCCYRCSFCDPFHCHCEYAFCQSGRETVDGRITIQYSGVLGVVDSEIIRIDLLGPTVLSLDFSFFRALTFQ